MKEAKISMRTTDIKAVKYDNTFTSKPGEPMKLNVKTNFAVKLNPAQPTTALVCVKFSATDEEAKTMTFEVETVTALQASTFIDNLDEVVKKNYMGMVMISVNEKIKSLTSTLGLNLQVPSVSFNYAVSDN